MLIVKSIETVTYEHDPAPRQNATIELDGIPLLVQRAEHRDWVKVFNWRGDCQIICLEGEKAAALWDKICGGIDAG